MNLLQTPSLAVEASILYQDTQSLSFLSDEISLAIDAYGIENEAGRREFAKVVQRERTIRANAERIREHLLLSALECVPAADPAADPDAAAGEVAVRWAQMLSTDASAAAAAWLHMTVAYDLCALADERITGALRSCLVAVTVGSLLELLDAVERDRDAAAAVVARGRPQVAGPPEGLPAGTAPHLIKDPELRQEYEAALGAVDDFYEARARVNELSMTALAITDSSGHCVQSLVASLDAAGREAVHRVVEPRKRGELSDRFVKEWLGELVDMKGEE